MNDKEAKETLKTMKENIDKKYLKTRNSVAIETILNILENQKAEIEDLKLKIQTQKELLKMKTREIEKKDNIIDLMAEWISNICFYKDDYGNSCEIIQDSCYEDSDCKQCIKQYFEKKEDESK